MYYQPETGRLFANHSEIRASLLHIAFNEIMDEESLEYNGIFPIIDQAPSVQSDQTADKVSIELVDGVWKQIYEVRQATEEELEARKPPVPSKVSRRQARSALLIRGYLDQVSIVIAAIPNEGARRLAQIEWEDATEFDRNRDLVIQIGTALGLDSKGLDDIFRLAATL